jgi:small subunit ribosomal protein S13
MPRIAGIDVRQSKQAKIALTDIYGIGRVTAIKLLLETNIDPEKKAEDLNNDEVNRLNAAIEANHKVEGELRQQGFRNIKRLKDIRAFRGVRHKKGLPTRGQNTRTNSRTRKGKTKAVGGLKRKLDKK